MLPSVVIALAAACGADDGSSDSAARTAAAGSGASTGPRTPAAVGGGAAGITSVGSSPGAATSLPLAVSGSGAQPLASGGRGGAGAGVFFPAGSGAGQAPAGRGAGTAGVQASAGQGGALGSAGGPAAMSGETGRMIGMTAAHNAVRAQVQTTPPLLPMTWSPTLAAYAQAWTDQLASSPTTCAQPMHRSGQELQRKGYGENLAASGSKPARMTTSSFAVDGWSGEVACWTYGTILGSERCDTSCYMSMHSDGCGHYTQLVWRDSTEVGCGVSTCTANGVTYDIWVCNYAPPGNVVGRAPY
jgi:pathogenesis-related protein 1